MAEAVALSASQSKHGSSWFCHSSSGKITAQAGAPTTEHWLWGEELPEHVFRTDRLACLVLDFLRGTEVLQALIAYRALEIPGRRILGSRLPVIHVFGGSDGRHEVDTCWRLDAASGEWEAMVPLPSGPRSLSAAAPLGGRICVVGGFNGSEFLNSMEVFAPHRQCWEPGPPLLQRRGGLALTTAGGHLYACGGREGSSYLNSVERFSMPHSACEPSSGSWQAMPAMSQGRCYAFAQQFQGRVWLCGGMERGNKYSNSVEQLLLDGHEDDSAWQPGPTMRELRAFASGCAISIGLCICGGSNAAGPLATAEVFTHGGQIWQALPDMEQQRTFASAKILVLPCGATGEHCTQRLFVFGGFNGKSYLSSGEVFMEEESRWAPTLPLPAPLIWTASAAVETPGRFAVLPSRTSPNQSVMGRGFGTRQSYSTGFFY
eukprot:TRINITY_DN45965_c0_g1_i1.p1 TRINITY_DN45965_c0_g1~~TRINITY_DN45965_c0_g1_i1.p1  ORF type:complete len:440 (-),score=65.66 TRINITY_DN45965_c0_g1_i1:153-1448(-)